MLTMPVAALLAFLLVVMIRKGGWKALPVITGMAFGLTLASTAVGPDITGLVNDFTGWAAAGFADLFANGAR